MLLNVTCCEPIQHPFLHPAGVCKSLMEEEEDERRFLCCSCRITTSLVTQAGDAVPFSRRHQMGFLLPSRDATPPGLGPPGAAFAFGSHPLWFSCFSAGVTPAAVSPAVCLSIPLSADTAQDDDDDQDDNDDRV